MAAVKSGIHLERKTAEVWSVLAREHGSSWLSLLPAGVWLVLVLVLVVLSAFPILASWR